MKRIPILFQTGKEEVGHHWKDIRTGPKFKGDTAVRPWGPRLRVPAKVNAASKGKVNGIVGENRMGIGAIKDT